MSHVKNVCKHGIVISQCRCPAPNKFERLVDCTHPDPVTELFDQDAPESP